METWEKNLDKKEQICIILINLSNFEIMVYQARYIVVYC